MGLHTQSTYARPSKGSATERVWQIADDLTRKTGEKARRKDVIEACVGEGGNANTASTQFYYWSQNFEQGKAYPDTNQSRAGESVVLRIDPSGRLVVPHEMREAMQLGENGRVTARIVDGELRIMTPTVALRKLQALTRERVPEGMSVVDEFIAEKRLEAERE